MEHFAGADLYYMCRREMEKEKKTSKEKI